MKATSSLPDDPAPAKEGDRPGRSRLPSLQRALRPARIDVAWAVFSLLNLIAIFWFENWETIPFHFIWISLTVLYGFRNWGSRPTMWLLAAVMVTTSSGIGLDVYRGTEPPAELTEVPLMAAVFWATVYHVRRKLAAENKYHVISEANARMLSDQRQFVQDAAHQLRTPITIALGHAELLSGSLAERVTNGARAGARYRQRQDIQVVIGELNQLRRISQNLLVIAAASDPEFLQQEKVCLDRLAADTISRWRPTASRHWCHGQLDQVTLVADKDRLSLALDALLDNAVRHTAEGDVIKLSVVGSADGAPARLIVADRGCGIPEDQQHLIFERFRTGAGSRSRGTGLGLPLVRAVARAHGGDVSVRSTLGEGSEFEVTLPALADSDRGAVQPAS